MDSVRPVTQDSALIEAARNRPSQDPIFAIHAEAVARAQTGEDIIDASLGVLLDDEGRLAILPAVHDAQRSVDPRRAAAYAPIAGDDEFCSAVVEDVFGGSPLRAMASAVATAGGTGALHHAVANFVGPGEALLTTDYHWGPYGTIADHTGRRLETFPMFSPEGRFALDEFEYGLDRVLERQGRAVALLNFPCHNPTGYTLDAGEWRRTVDILLARAADHPVTLLLDLAYERYAPASAPRWVDEVARLVAHAPVLVAWSASKSFALYGARVGALIAVERDAGELQRIRNSLSYSCRATWSNCNHQGLLTVSRLLSEPERAQQVDAQRAGLVGLLDERVRLFNTEAARQKLDHPRYEAGFFVTVFTPDPTGTARACADLGVFVVPIRGAVRVALCATPASQVPRLVAVLARGVQAVQ